MQILIVVAITLAGVVGDYFLKLAGSGSHYIELKWFFAGALIYASTSAGWFFIMKYMKLSTLGVVYAVTIVISLAIMGSLFFKESLSAYEIIGIFLGIISILLLGRFL